MNKATLLDALQNLTPDERQALITIFYLLQTFHYSEVTDDDIYMSVPDFDYDQSRITMTALREKQLIELHDGAAISVPCTNDLNEAELHVLVSIVDFQHAFSKVIDFPNIYGNVRNMSEDELLVHLIKLAQLGLITLDEHYTVSETFSGTVLKTHLRKEASNAKHTIFTQRGRSSSQ